ncbi:MAG: hypothetical protein C4520_09795 [Candidatus Abyssobacteria bacterium SURF_5]|uniref:Uncharacterized protein n=1 Tax=Abyssobacteria bacterium (strain SURF_5) TaxID=2093360 RepID=A0A3A4NLC1_ABYX5|nr:MAG: hypothetical protein C4520_09795 [Candidatus Abyssubacteria bacterium SURF_5]
MIGAAAIEQDVLQTNKKPFLQRLFLSAGAALIVMLLSSLAYHNSWKIGSDAAQQLVASISAVILFISIGFGASFVYPFLRKSGAGPAERILASLAVPAVWNVKEMIRVSEFFTFGETLYYGLNQVFLLAVFASLAQMGLLEIIMRWRQNHNQEQKIALFSPIPLISIGLGLVAFYIIMLWGTGVHFFYWYGRLYRLLFF